MLSTRFVVLAQHGREGDQYLGTLVFKHTEPLTTVEINSIRLKIRKILMKYESSDFKEDKEFMQYLIECATEFDIESDRIVRIHENNFIAIN